MLFWLLWFPALRRSLLLRFWPASWFFLFHHFLSSGCDHSLLFCLAPFFFSIHMLFVCECCYGCCCCHCCCRCCHCCCCCCTFHLDRPQLIWSHSSLNFYGFSGHFRSLMFDSMLVAVFHAKRQHMQELAKVRAHVSTLQLVWAGPTLPSMKGLKKRQRSLLVLNLAQIGCEPWDDTVGQHLAHFEESSTFKDDYAKHSCPVFWGSSVDLLGWFGGPNASSLSTVCQVLS